MRKIGIRFYTIPEYEEEQEYLSKMHRKGWQFVKFVLPCFYLFEKCTPENVIYQLDYNQDGLREKDAYYQMYQDCGWEHLCDVVGYSYFSKKADNKNSEEEIFSDDASKMDMVDRVYQGRLKLCLKLFFAIICPVLIATFVWQFFVDSYAIRIVFGLYLVIFIVYVIMFGKFYTKRRKLRKRMYI